MRTLILVALAAGSTAFAPLPADAPLLSYLQVGSHRIAFEADTVVEHGARLQLVPSTFADVSHALGPAVVGTRGDAGDAFGWMCYRLSGSQRMSLLLESDEIHGVKWIGDFELIRAGSHPSLERHCAALDVPATAVVSNTGLRLGLTRGEVQATLGVAGRDSADVVVYDRTRDMTMRTRDGRREPYTQSSGFTVRFVRGRVVEFSGYRLDAS